MTLDNVEINQFSKIIVEDSQSSERASSSAFQDSFKIIFVKGSSGESESADALGNSFGHNQI